MFSRYLIRLSRSEAFSVIRQPISRLLPFGIITHIAHVCAAAEYNVCVCVCVCVLKADLAVQWNSTLYTISLHHKTKASAYQWQNSRQIQELPWLRCSHLLWRRKLTQLNVITVKFFITLVSYFQDTRYIHIFIGWFVYLRQVSGTLFRFLPGLKYLAQFSVKFCNIKSCENPFSVFVVAVCLQARGPNGHSCTRMQTHQKWTS